MFDTRPAADANQRILTVSALARQSRLLLEERFNLVWVEGELSNLRVPGSGHWYFSLKDDEAQLRFAMFAGRNRAVGFKPRDGDQVLVRGRVTLYEPRGDFQIIAEHMAPAGEGALRAAFDALKLKLEQEGLFDADRKRPLSEHPRSIAVISSASGAALHDVLHVIDRRFPGLQVTLLPVAVQGPSAATHIIAALEQVGNLRPPPDAVLITRGGGSLEDLQCFNLESVARAVVGCPVPTIAAIGHQTDFTIVDFVADVRAPTPSAGAELVTPDREELTARFAQWHARLSALLSRDLQLHGARLKQLRSSLRNPHQHLQRQMQRADELEERLGQALRHRLRRSQNEMNAAARALRVLHPQRLASGARDRVTHAARRLGSVTANNLAIAHERLAGTVRTLQAVSPLATLSRGYAVLTVPSPPGTLGAAITRSADVDAGTSVQAHLRDGSLLMTVVARDDDYRLPELPAVLPERDPGARSNDS